MCRHLAYVGDPVALGTPLFDAPHALSRQAQHPRLQVWGDTNPDGWGVAWYSPTRPAPERHRTTTPIWNDTAFAARAVTITSPAFLAAARLASPGATLVDIGNAPFVSGEWSFSLNGIVDGFRDGVDAILRAQLEPTRAAAIASDADTEVLFAHVLQRLDAGEDPVRALAGVIGSVTALTTGRLNLLLTDGHDLYGTRYGNSLFRRGTTLASEPIDDDPAWEELGDECLVTIRAGAASVTPL
jgi:glutamine amidotransferase